MNPMDRLLHDELHHLLDRIAASTRAGVAKASERQLPDLRLRLDEAEARLSAKRQVLLDHSDEIADLITTEQGKPRVESYTMEVLPTVDLLHWCADNGPKILAQEPVRYPQILLKQKKSAFSYEPIGVVGV